MDDFVVREQSESGLVEVIGAVDPLSLQASADRKVRFKQSLSAAVASASTGTYTGDVRVGIEWFVPERVRYGTHIVADIDNVVKPLLDAVTGPDGIMIDDNQVQSLGVSWTSPVIPDMKFRMTTEPLMQGEYRPRAGLTFVEFSADRCYPILGEVQEVANSLVEHLEDRLRCRSAMIDAGMPEHEADTLMPIQRFFPKARLGRFTIRPFSDYPLG